LKIPTAALWMTGALVVTCCALPTAAQVSGVTPEPGAPSPGGVTILDDENRVTATGALRYWRAHSTHGGRAMLKVFRPEGGRLVLVGSSPLVTLAPGETGTFACSIPVSRNDLIGCFCPDANCVDRGATGSVLVADGDLGTSEAGVFTPETGAPAVFAASTRSFDVPSRAANDLVVPVVSRGPGAAGTLWATSLEIFNTGVQEAQVALYLNLSDRDNTIPAASAQAIIPARSLLVIEDLLSQTFDMEEATGSVDLISSERIIAHSKITNIGGAAGGFGQKVPAVPAAWSLGDDEAAGLEPNSDIAYLFAVRQDDSYRTNAGVANLSGFTLEVDLEAFDGTSRVGRSVRLALPPFSHTQINRVLNLLQTTSSQSGLRLNVSAAQGSAARFIAYSSRVDNLSGDAVFQIADRQPPLPD